MSSSDSLGDVFRVGSTPFRKPARKDGKYTWMMFERLTGCLQPLIQYCLCRWTLVPCRWKAKEKKGRGEIRLHFVHLGNLEFSLCGRIARWKAFFLFFFLPGDASKGQQDFWQSACVEAMSNHVEVTQCHCNSHPVTKTTKCHTQFLTQYKAYTWCGHAEFPATESAYWLVIHGRSCVLSDTREKHVCLSRRPRGVSCPRTLNWPLVLLSSSFLIVVMAIPPHCKARPGCCIKLHKGSPWNARPALGRRLPNLNVTKGEHAKRFGRNS